MILTLTEHNLKVTREPTDPKFYGTVHAKGEHRLFEHIKRELIKLGYDVIKKRAQKDGHMIGDEFQPYIRSRSKKTGGLMIYSGFYALHGANEDFNKGEVTLLVERY